MIDSRLQALANRIKYLIELSPYSQVEIADRLGVDKSVITRWMNGGRTPTMKNLMDLSEVLGVEMNDLWQGAEAVPATPEQKMMVEVMKSLSPEAQQMLLANASMLKGRA